MNMFYNTPMLFPDGLVRVLDTTTGMWVQVTPLGVSPSQPVAVPPPSQARAASQPPSQAPTTASSISEEIAEEVLAPQPEPVVAAAPIEPVAAEALAELPTKARSSVPIPEEEVVEMSSPPMVFLSSQDRHYPASESGVSSTTVDLSETTTVDLSEADFAPLQQKSPASDTIEVQKYRVERRVQMRTGPTADSEKVCILNPGQRVHVVKTKTSRTKAGFITTKAYVLSDHGQGWVSVNRQSKKTDETFVFKGQVGEGLKKSLPLEKVWARHEAEVQDITNTSNNTFSVRVSCPTWQKVEALRVALKRNNVKGRKLINRRPSQLVNLRRVFGNTAPCAHVYDIDVDVENEHRQFLVNFDWSAQHRGSTADFAHQVRGDLRQCGFPGARRVEWSTGRTCTGYFTMRDFCSVEFSKDSHLRQFLKNFEKYDFFYGAKVTVDPQYANLATVPANLVKA